jgi:hypothetical protein
MRLGLGGVNMEKTAREIIAVLDEELADVLERLGLKTRLDEGSLVCSACGDAVTVESIGLIYQRTGEPHVVCNKSRCMLSFALGGEQ